MRQKLCKQYCQYVLKYCETFKGPKLLGGWIAFMDIQNISNHFPFIYKTTQEIHGKHLPKYDFNK